LHQSRSSLRQPSRRPERREQPVPALARPDM